MILTLPWPPTANRRLVPAKRRWVTAPEYRAWQERAAIAILKQWQPKYRGTPWIADGELEIRIDARYPDRRRRDLDNCIKPVLDALVRAGIIVDDSCISRIDAWRDSEPIAGGELRVTIRAAESARRLQPAGASRIGDGL